MKVLLLAGLLIYSVLPASAHLPALTSSCELIGPLAVSFDGVVETAGPARWQVSGQIIDLDAATAIEPAGAAPAPGDPVSVSALWRLDGSLQATRIDASPAPQDDPPFQFTGLVEAMEPGRWTIGGAPVAVTPETILVGQAAVGSVALVQARPTATLPRALLVAAAPPGVDPVFLDGVLLAVEGDLWRLQAGSAAVDVLLSPGAFVQGAPVVGRQAQVMALEQAGQPLEALYAAVLPDGDERVYFGGRLVALITATLPEQWLVLAASEQGPWLDLRTVTVDRLAVPIDETAGPAIAGAWIEVTAIAPRWPGQPWTARSLRVDLGPQATAQGVLGLVDDSTPARWQVGDTCVIVDPQTAVDGRPRAERYAIAHGTQLGAVAVWARDAAVRYRFEGTLAARLAHVTPPVWVVLVAPPSHVDASPPTRVYLTIDATSRIDPSLLSGVLGIAVAVQARAGQSGWLADWVDDPATPWQPEQQESR